MESLDQGKSKAEPGEKKREKIKNWLCSSSKE
jgi:hypothetical protein